MSRDGAIGAFFDVDGTLLSVHSGSLYAGYLRRQGLLSYTDQIRILWGIATYRVGLLNMRRLGEIATRFLRDRSEVEMIAQCRDWYAEEVRHHLDPVMVEHVRDHQARGHVVALLTAGTRYLNDLVAKDAGIEHVLATELEVENGRFTGRAVPPFCYGRGKIQRAEAFAARHGIDLAASYFYTDSMSDLPMLLRVGNPRIVRPDPRLRLEAQRRGWPLVDGVPASRPAREAERTKSPGAA